MRKVLVAISNELADKSLTLMRYERNLEIDEMKALSCVGNME